MGEAGIILIPKASCSFHSFFVSHEILSVLDKLPINYCVFCLPLSRYSVYVRGHVNLKIDDSARVTNYGDISSLEREKLKEVSHREACYFLKKLS